VLIFTHAAQSFSTADLWMEDDYSAGKDVFVTIRCVSQQILLSGFGG